MYIFALETTEYAKQSRWKNRGCVPKGVIRLSRGGTCLRAFGSSSVLLSPGLIYCSLRLRQLNFQVPPLPFNCVFLLSITPSLTYAAMTVISLLDTLKPLCEMEYLSLGSWYFARGQEKLCFCIRLCRSWWAQSDRY